ncbi:MAG: sulfurtransferase TusA family protein [Thermodesulfobacteriota bacterium]
MNFDLEHIIPEKVMDIRGLESPLTRSKARKALNTLGPGKILEIWCTDRDFVKEMEKSEDLEGNQYIGCRHDPEGYVRLYLVRK